MNQNWPEWWPIGMGIAIFVIFGLMAMLAPRQLRAAWTAAFAFAKRRRWTLVAPGEMPTGLALIRTPLTVSGRERDRRLRLRSYSVGSGKHQQHWLALEVDLEIESPPVRIREENFFSRLAEKVGQTDFKTGDAAFDERFRLSEPDPTVVNHPSDPLAPTHEVVRAFLPEWRKAMMAAWPKKTPGATLACYGRHIAFERLVGPTAKAIAAMDPMVDIVLDLADYLEAYSTARRNLRK